MGTVNWFLGTHFEWSSHQDGSLSVHLSQEAHVQNVAETYRLASINFNSLATPTVPDAPSTPLSRPPLTRRTRSLCGAARLPVQGRPSHLACHQYSSGSLHCRVISLILQQLPSATAPQDGPVCGPLPPVDDVARHRLPLLRFFCDVRVPSLPSVPRP